VRANINANSAFQDMTGWTVIGEGKNLADLFVTNADGLAAGFNSVKSTAATAGEGMYFKFEPTDASATYVVSFKMKGAALNNTRVRVADGVDENVVKVEGNTDGAYAGGTDVLLCNTAEELTENWQTFNYAIVGDGKNRTYFISLVSMATTIEVADLQIAPALQFADLRQRDAMLEKLNAYKNCYNWGESVLDEEGMSEAIANLEDIGDESGQADLDELLETAQEVLDEFLKKYMEDYLAGGNRDNYFDTWRTKIQKWAKIGDWTSVPNSLPTKNEGRFFWEKAENSYPDIGHYAGNSSWCGGSPDSPMGVYMQKTLDPGSYVFAIEGSAAVREKNTSSSWTNNDAWNVAYAVAYIVKGTYNKETNDKGEEVETFVPGDTIVSVVKNLDAVVMTPFVIAAKIEENGIYEIGYKAYCKDTYKSLKNGSVAYVANASLWGKNENQYSQKQLSYETDVREQITTGRNALTKAAEYIASEDYLWGKDALQDSIAKFEPLIAGYEAYTQEQIIETFDESYVKDNRTKTAEEGLLVYEVYDTAVRGILAANKKFEAVNDTLNSMQTIIDAAEATLALRIYDAATGKEALHYSCI